MEELGAAQKIHARRRGKGNVSVMIVAGLAFLMAAGGLTISILNATGVIGDNSTTVINTNGYYDGNSASFTEGSIAEVANKVAPSVVSILTTTRTQSFYGGGRTNSSAGTGMIVTSNGYVLTNKHVVEGVNEVTVTMSDGETYENVKVVGVDPLNDVAFLKIDGVSDLPAVTLGDSKNIMVGQPVIAIGNALGQYQNTITQGIISGTGRSITARGSGGSFENLSDMIQTDASINPGNSGGPLVNAAGHVIGINTAVSEDANGIGFAIPIGSVKGMLAGLIETGRVQRPYVGVSFIPIMPDVARQYNLPVRAGAYVYSDSGSAIVRGSPADRAGIRDRDIITAVNNIEIGAGRSLSSLVAEHKVGDTIQLKILRGEEELTVNVTLAVFNQ
jgi:serine protease Do